MVRILIIFQVYELLELLKYSDWTGVEERVIWLDMGSETLGSKVKSDIEFVCVTANFLVVVNRVLKFDFHI